MAKVGDVSVSGGTSASIKSAVMGDLTPNLTLGQVAAASLRGTEDNLVVEILFGDRGVHVRAAESADDLPVRGTHGAEFTLDDPTKKVGAWTGVGDAALIAIANAQSKPQRSLASLISAIEDAKANGDVPAGVNTVVVDQVGGRVIVYDNQDTPDLTDFENTADLAAFEAPVATTSGTAHGPFE